MKKYLLSAVLAATSLAAYSFFRTSSQHESVHYHAGFIVYVNGIKQDFTNFRYMNLTPCSKHGKEKSPEEEQIELAHLHDGVGDVVHVHRSGAVWGDLFRNIGFTFPADIPIIGEKNGEKIDNILKQPIRAYESIVIIVGNTTVLDRSEIVTPEHIQEVEAKSELCGSGV